MKPSRLRSAIDRIFHLGTMEVEAFVVSVNPANGTFEAVCPNIRNGRGCFHVTLQLQNGQAMPRIGQVIFVNARIHSVKISG